VYIDWRGVDWNDPTTNVKAMVDAGFNVIILAFYMTSGPVDVVQAWAGLSSTKRASSVAYAHSKGAIVLMAVGGSTGACVCYHMCICVFVCVCVICRRDGSGVAVMHTYVRACMHMYTCMSDHLMCRCTSRVCMCVCVQCPCGGVQTRRTAAAHRRTAATPRASH
jgi:hypothetical protein